MAIYRDEHTTQRAMLEGVNSHLRQALRERFQAVADEIIEAAIADAMKTFDIAVQAYADPYRMREVVEVVLRDQRKPINALGQLNG